MRLQNLSMPKSNSSVPTLEGLLTRNSSSSVFPNYMPIPTKFLLTHNPHTSQTSTTPTPPPPTTHKKNEQQAQRLNCSFPLSTAVRTRLELATPCVTGMYSNQLNYRTSCRVCITAFFRFACAKLLLFPHSRKFFSKKFAFYPIFL